MSSSLPAPPKKVQLYWLYFFVWKDGVLEDVFWCRYIDVDCIRAFILDAKESS